MSLCELPTVVWYIYYICLLSASAIHRGAIWFPVLNVFHTDRLCYAVLGDATLTIGPYGSPGTCIVNCAISQFTDPGEWEST